MANMWSEAFLAYLTVCLDIVVAFIHAKVLFMVGAGNRAEYVQVIQCFLDKDHVMDICARDCHGQRNAVCVGQETSLDTFFFPYP